MSSLKKNNKNTRIIIVISIMVIIVVLIGVILGVTMDANSDGSGSSGHIGTRYLTYRNIHNRATELVNAELIYN